MSIDNNEILRQASIRKNKFDKYNKKKLITLYRNLETYSLTNAFDSLPILLINNQQGIPGYVENEEVPSGIMNFSADKKGLHFLKIQFPGAEFNVSPASDPFIKTYALMGSGGTIAFTAQSDFDIWLCYEEQGYSSGAINAFRSKCQRIENWMAKEHNIEVHFYLNEISKIQKNVFDEDSDEQYSGINLGELLKEEFFRTSIVLYGKTPFWWAVPPGADDNDYADWISSLKGDRAANDFVDLGNLSVLSGDDYLVEALFQILKSLGNPFKSIMKLGLLEEYIHSKTATPYISHEIKENIHADKLGPEDIDSYVIMFNRVYDFYKNNLKDNKSASLVEKAFYLKINPMLSKPAKEAEPTDQYKIMDEYIKSWQWDESLAGRLDNFTGWNVEEVAELWSQNKGFILSRYKAILSRINKDDIYKKISEDVLKGINNQVLSFFSVGEGKIDNSMTFKQYPAEKFLSIQFNLEKDRSESWLVVKSHISGSGSVKLVIHRDKTLIGVLAWIALNNLYQPGFTRMEISKSIYQVDTGFIRDLAADLSAHFSIKKLDIKNSYYAQKPFPLINYIIFNPYSKYDGKAENFIYLYHNSWGETRFEFHDSISSLPGIISRILSGSIKASYDFESSIRIVSSHPFRTSNEFFRLGYIVLEMFNILISSKGDEERKFVTEIGNQFVVFSNEKSIEGRKIKYSVHGSELKLLYSLSKSTGLKQKWYFDFNVQGLNYLMTINENNLYDTVQIFFEQENKYCYFFVADERGAIIFFRKDPDDFYSYLASLFMFSKNAVKSAVENNPGSPLAGNSSPVRLYELKREFNNCNIRLVNPKNYLIGREKDGERGGCAIQPHILESGEVGYRFTLPDGSYSDIFNAETIQEIPGELKKIIESTPGYSYFVSDISMSHISNKLYRDYTSYSFTEKNRFELLIEKGLKKIEN